MTARRQTHPRAVDCAMLRWLENHGDQGVFTTDTEPRHPQLEPVAGDRRPGLPPATSIGRPLLEVLPSLVERGLDQYYAMRSPARSKVLSQRCIGHLLPCPSATGGSRCRRARGSRRSSTATRVVGTITVIEDVSERVTTERELRAQIAAAESARAHGGSGVARQGRVPGDAVARDPDAAQRGARLDPHPAGARARRGDRPARRRGDRPQRHGAADADQRHARHGADRQRQDAARGRRRRHRDGRRCGDRRRCGRPPTARASSSSPSLPPTPAASDAAIADRLLQVVWNLLSNAVKFTDAGGTGDGQPLPAGSPCA